jgi:uncharacterized protein (DUF1501 family)
MKDLDRRTALKLGGSGLLWALLSRRPLARAGTPAAAHHCIVLWMNGGPSHLETFDPKAASAFRAIGTRAPDLEIGEHLPQLADQAHRLTVLRGLSSREGSHERAQYLLRTGYAPSATAAYPALGAWVSHELGHGGSDLPDYVGVCGPAVGAGFLGIEHAPFLVRDPRRPPEDTSWASQIDFVRFLRRRAALDAFEQNFARETEDSAIQSRRQLYGKAIRLMFSPRLRVFDLDEEPFSVRKAYGESDFGRGCLLARRLVERGVRFVEVMLDGWDTHADNATRTAHLCGVLDPAMATLLRELGDRDLLSRTLVVWLGEFGRSPRVNANGGRDHHPAAFSAVLAGANLRSGTVYGRTDATGEKVVEGEIRVPDLMATVMTILGLDPQKSVPTPRGRPVALTDGGRVVAALLCA